jgi:hypothetical protein
MTSLVACKSSSGGASTDFCQAVDSLASTVQTINQSAEAKSSIKAVKTSQQQVDKGVQTLKDNADAKFATEVQAVENDVAQLDNAIAAAGQSPKPANVNEVRVTFRNFTASVNDLSKATSSSC